MQIPSASVVLETWDRWVGATLPERAVAILATTMSKENARALTVSERDRRLIELRRELVGRTLDMTFTCPKCGVENGLSVDLDSLLESLAPLPPLEGSYPRAFAVSADGWTVEGRIPTAGDLCAVARCTTVRDGRAELIGRIIERAWLDGERQPAGKISPGVYDAIAAEIEAIVQDGDVQFRVSCPGCESENTADFDITSYFWTELTQIARRLLWEVHALAEAYGWSESHILAMSSRRRRMYLEMLG